MAIYDPEPLPVDEKEELERKKAIKEEKRSEAKEKKRKGAVTIALLAALAAPFAFASPALADDSEPEEIQQQQSNFSPVVSEIDDFVNDEDYIESDFSERQEMLQTFLQDLKDKGELADFNFAGGVFSYQTTEGVEGFIELSGAQIPAATGDVDLPTSTTDESEETEIQPRQATEQPDVAMWLMIGVVAVIVVAGIVSMIVVSRRTTSPFLPDSQDPEDTGVNVAEADTEEMEDLDDVEK